MRRFLACTMAVVLVATATTPGPALAWRYLTGAGAAGFGSFARHSAALSHFLQGATAEGRTDWGAPAPAVSRSHDATSGPRRRF
jgi:hypothetical protein